VRDEEVLEIFARHRTDECVIAWPASRRAVLERLGHGDPGILYTNDFASAAPTCFGLAIARPERKVVAIEGDGSLLAGLAHLTTLGRYRPQNVVILVLDNEGYDLTVGSIMPTATATGADLGAIARDAGVPHAATVTTVKEAEHWLARAFHEDGPFVIVAKVQTVPRAAAQRSSTRADRVEDAVGFRRWLIDQGSGTGTPRLRETRLEPRAAEDTGQWQARARALYQALRDAGINLFIYLPDTITYRVQELAERDSEMATLCCAREDEGVAIASGAYFGGLWPALVLEGSGIGLSALNLALCLQRRTPLLLVPSHSEALGARFDYDAGACLTTEPLLRALGIPYVVLGRVEDAPVVVRESVQAMQVLKKPMGVVIPPYLLSDRGVGWADRPSQAG
jgi:thiamine pyrophosphate-dependent acetolactate synthase large subunit-like protein